LTRVTDNFHSLSEEMFAQFDESRLGIWFDTRSSLRSALNDLFCLPLPKDAALVSAG
jgi:hypothetical protein